MHDDYENKWNVTSTWSSPEEYPGASATLDVVGTTQDDPIMYISSLWTNVNNNDVTTSSLEINTDPHDTVDRNYDADTKIVLDGEGWTVGSTECARAWQLVDGEVHFDAELNLWWLEEML